MRFNKLFDEETGQQTKVEDGDIIYFDPVGFSIFIIRNPTDSDRSCNRLLFWDSDKLYDNKEIFYWNDREFEKMVRLIAALCGLEAHKFEHEKYLAYKLVA